MIRTGFELPTTGDHYGDIVESTDDEEGRVDDEESGLRQDQRGPHSLDDGDDGDQYVADHTCTDNTDKTGMRNVMRAISHGEDRKHTWLALEHCARGDLFELLQISENNRIDPIQAREYFK